MYLYRQNYWFSLISVDFHWFSLVFIDFHWFSSFPWTMRLCLLIRWLSTLNQDISKGNDFHAKKKVLRQDIRKKYPAFLWEVPGRLRNVLMTLGSLYLWFGTWSSQPAYENPCLSLYSDWKIVPILGLFYIFSNCCSFTTSRWILMFDPGNES